MNRKAKHIAIEPLAEVAALSINLSSGIVIYGTGGSYGSLPNEIIHKVQDSGTAMNCISRIRDFIKSGGFTDPVNDSLRVNPAQTAGDILSEIADYQAYFQGAFALRIMFRNDGLVGGVYCVKLETLRRNTDGSFIYNPNMGAKVYKKGDDITIPAFDLGKSPQQRVVQIGKQMTEHGKQLGEILYVFEKSAGYLREWYPIPDYYSGIDDIEADAALSRLEKRNIKKGWKASVIISTPYRVDDEEEDNNGKTDADYLDEELTKFASEDGSSILRLEGEGADSLPKIDSFPIDAILDATQNATTRIASKVCRHIGVPPVLAGMDVSAILGNQQAIANSLRLFNYTISARQRIVERTFTMLFPGKDWSITKADLFQYLPTEVYSKLSDDELRELGGFAPMPQITTTEADKTLNALNTMSPLVANKVLDSLSQDEIRALVGKLPIIQEGVTPNG